MILGIDFDNTIVDYNEAFYWAAIDRELISKTTTPSKQAVRDDLRSKSMESQWTLLQGYIYGSRMDLAKPFDGVENFLQKYEGPRVIISHKTLHPFQGPKYPLHKAAKEWLCNQSFGEIEAFFELTLEKKLNRIGEQKCTHFIDDLPEVFAHESFPSNVIKILFDPMNHHQNHDSYTRCTSWQACLTFLSAR